MISLAASRLFSESEGISIICCVHHGQIPEHWERTGQINKQGRWMPVPSVRLPETAKLLLVSVFTLFPSAPSAHELYD